MRTPRSSPPRATPSAPSCPPTTREIKTFLATHDADIKAALQAHHVAITNQLTANQNQSVKMEIEQALADTNDNKRISYFYLPQASGGLLEVSGRPSTSHRQQSGRRRQHRPGGRSLNQADASYAAANTRRPTTSTPRRTRRSQSRRR